MKDWQAIGFRSILYVRFGGEHAAAISGYIEIDDVNK